MVAGPWLSHRHCVVLKLIPAETTKASVATANTNTAWLLRKSAWQWKVDERCAGCDGRAVVQGSGCVRLTI